MKTWKEIKNKHLATLVIGLAILVMSAIPGETVEYLGMGNETYHIKGHFIMYILLCLALYKSTKNLRKSFFISSGYGILMELMQKFIPGRSFEYKDILINSFGALIALGILWKRSLFLPKRLKSWLEK